MEYRPIHLNCARPVGRFDFSNEFVQVFVALLPRIFRDAESFDGLIHQDHGLRCPGRELAPTLECVSISSGMECAGHFDAGDLALDG